MTDTILIIGRVLFALLFISSGISHFTKTSAMTGYAQFKKVPMAKFSVLLSGAMILLGQGCPPTALRSQGNVLLRNPGPPLIALQSGQSCRSHCWSLPA